MKNVLMLCWSFPPAAGSGVYRSAKFAKYLPQMGWKPLVVTSLEALASGSRDRSLLGELPDEVEVVYTPRTSAAVRSLERLLNTVRMDWVQDLMEFPDPFVHWIPQAVRAVCRLVGRRQIHAVYTSVDPFSTGLAGLILKRITRLPWVIDFRDPWTLMPFWRWPSKLHLALARRVESEIVRRADAVVMNTPTAARMMKETYAPQRRDKIVWIPNGFDADDVPLGIDPGTGDGTCTIAYTGTLFRASWDYSLPGHPLWSKIAQRLQVLPDPALVRSARSADYFFRSLSEVVRRKPKMRKYLRVELAGRLPADGHTQMQELGLQDIVRFRGYLPQRESVKLLWQSSLLFLPQAFLKDGRRLPAVPGKIYEYMAMGKPILAAMAPGDARDFLTEAGLGIFCQPANVTDLAETILRSCGAHQKGELKVQPNWRFINQFERKKLTKRLADVLNSISGR